MSYEWPKMIEVLPESKVGEAEIKHVTVTPDDAKWASIQRERLSPGRYAQLFIKGGLMMSDTDNERITNSSVVIKANGDVLIAGLGMGWILHPILAQPDVRSVTVIEKSFDVISLVAPSLARYGDRVTIVNADIFDWVPPKRVWDTIYFDIWRDICEDNLEEISRLNRKFARRLNRSNPKAWRGAWCEEELRYRRRRNAMEW